METQESQEVMTIHNEDGSHALTILNTNEIVNRQKAVHNAMEQVMVEGHHYGPAFGGNDKKVLLKPGAEILQSMFQLNIEYSIDKLQEGDHREYEIKAIAIHYPTGLVVGQGVGSCSTKESKYRYRKEGRTCPSCGKEGTIIKGKREYGGGWLCFNKKGGCGAKFNDGDPKIEDQETGKVENPDIADSYNTVLKIGKKRAQVDCILGVTAASNMFTQDLDDMPEYQREAQHKMNAPQNNDSGNSAPPPQRQNGNSHSQPQEKPKEEKHPLADLKNNLWKMTKHIESEESRKTVQEYIKKEEREKPLRELGNRLVLSIKIDKKIKKMRSEEMISEEEYNLYQDALNECRKTEDYKNLKETLKARIEQAHKNVDATFDKEELERKVNPEPRLKSNRTAKKNTQQTSVNEAVESTQHVIERVNPDEYSKQNNLPFK